jgi:hypothetical protein
LESAECVSFQGFAIAARRAKMRQTAGNCAISLSRNLCDSRKYDFNEEIENMDMAERWPITFFGPKAFSAEKISSPTDENFPQAVSKNRCLTPV